MENIFNFYRIWTPKSTVHSWISYCHFIPHSTDSASLPSLEQSISILRFALMILIKELSSWDLLIYWFISPLPHHLVFISYKCHTFKSNWKCFLSLKGPLRAGVKLSFHNMKYMKDACYWSIIFFAISMYWIQEIYVDWSFCCWLISSNSLVCCLGNSPTFSACCLSWSFISWLKNHEVFSSEFHKRTFFMSLMLFLQFSWYQFFWLLLCILHDR